MTDGPNDEINRIMIATAERLAAAGVRRDEVPHALIGAGLAMLDVGLCGDCLVETVEEVREEIDDKISEAERHAQ
jgi:predicted transcriptional regulator